MVRRIFAEKKKDFATEAAGLMADLKQNLHLKNLDGLRIINRYDVEGIDEKTYDMAKYTVFAEPAVDAAFEEELPDLGSANFFAVEYLPGQYDQRADSAAQCISLMKPGAQATVKYAKIYILEGELSKSDIAAVKGYVINPVDSREAAAEKPDSLQMETVRPDDVMTVEGFTKMDEEGLETYRNDMGLAMSREDLLHIHKFFKDTEKRDPTMTEIKVIDTYWSDHCRHTTFSTELTDIYFENGPYGELVKEAFSEYMEMRRSVYGDRKKDINLMDMACIGAKYLKKEGKATDLDDSLEINACSIKVKAKIDGKEEDWLVMFKNETHNHPTEIEPFGGAATCLGGAIRDPLSGRVYVYQAMRVTGAADPRVPVEDTMKGKLPQRKITREAAMGYSSYGNQIGLATGQVDEVYDPDYVAKRMEVGAVIGAAPADHVIREIPEPGDMIILVGGRTGRDGCGGATGSSKAHTEESTSECGAEVQKGNPPVERNIQRLFRRKEAATLIRRCNDFGAGGVSVAIGELADGLDINLDLVPKKYEGLDGTELAISESQERMAVVVKACDEAKFKTYASEENLEATTVAKVTDTNRVKMFWRGKKILDLDRDFLNTNGATQRVTVKVKANNDLAGLKPYNNVEDYLSDLNCCSRKGLIERFDSTIGASTVLMPLGGKYQLSPACGMASKLPVTEGETDTATLMAYGFDPKIAKASPYHGAMYAVIDSVTKIVAMGGDRKKIRLTFQEYFEKLTGDESWGKPMSALLGALKVQKELEIPSIGGKDSMSGTFEDISVPPALLSFAVDTIDAGQVISTEFKKAGSRIVLLPSVWDSRDVIDFEKYRRSMDKVRELAAEGKILAACNIGQGGVFMAAVKMAVGNKTGVCLSGITEKELSYFSYGSILLEIPKKEDIPSLMGDVDHRIVGHTTDSDVFRFDTGSGERKLSLSEMIKKWEAPLEGVFPVRTDDFKNSTEENVPEAPAGKPSAVGPAIKIARPRILIPTFPGTNCEMDSKRAFERAGGSADIHIIRNMTPEDLNGSISQLAEKIKESQIVMLPGGFSGGDEPDGSAKFITAVFRNPAVSDAVADLLENRDGLMLGICNGFQALIKLGLVPYGKIVDGKDDSPTLTYNKIGRHQSQLIRTRVASKVSPWLSGTEVGQIHTVAISHGEGNFICSDELLKQLAAGGQIATQYVDMDGKPSMDISFNPNHSVMAVEGITSPDGRVFGKMAHAERIGENVYKNVDGDKDMKIFESGVRYFK
ncbi:MAG: phosphoribosylformylglycinamidine synthase [Eubacteriaceae bacterium]|nr:phosphoribosylformylglycinamidine synthase [Eubacteriaceae bacterium]